MYPLLAKRLDEVLFVVLELVAKKLVEEELVNTDEEAKNVPLVDRVLTAERYSIVSPNAIPPDDRVDDARVSIDVGVDVPIPMFPLANIVNIDTPVEEATLNGLSAVEVEDCTLNAYVEDVALIPATTPLSNRVEVPKVLIVNQRVA
jgi:hypothetical protein